MNAFTALVPDQRGLSGPTHDVNLYLDADGETWVAESDSLPLATEAATLDALVKRVWEIAPEVAEMNGNMGQLQLRFILRTAAPA